MGTKLQAVIDEAKKLYPDQDLGGKALLTALFGEEHFETRNIMQRVTTFEEACAVLNLTISDQFNDDDTVDEAAYKKLKIVARALNEGWKPDWSDSNQYKYFPYFEYKAGFGFSYSSCVTWYTCALVGSRLSFKSRELAEYAGKQFESIYNDYLTIQ